jgi:homoaconitase/3-isopropylmalate dehydratase large subunit
MLSHLKLHFNNASRNDESVLGAYPSTIRRRVLRHLYLGILQVGASGCLAGCLADQLLSHWHQAVPGACCLATHRRSWQGRQGSAGLYCQCLPTATCV